MTATIRWRDHVTLDRQAAYLATLLVSVAAGAVWYARQLTAADYTPDTPVGGPDASATEAAGAGAAWAGAEVVVAGGLLATLAIYRWLPEWGQRVVKANAIVLFFLYLGGSWGRAGVLVPGIALVVTLVTIYIVTDHFDVWWLVNNLLAVVLAVGIGGYVALVFGVYGLLVALLALTVYDHVFANEREWMFDIASALVRLRAPVLFVKPPSWRYDFDDVLDADDADHSQWAIGMADLALPAAFAAAVAVAPAGALVTGGVFAAAGVVLGVAVAAFRLRYELLSRGSGAGLPALTAGALAGFVLFQPAALVV